MSGNKINFCQLSLKPEKIYIYIKIKTKCSCCGKTTRRQTESKIWDIQVKIKSQSRHSALMRWTFFPWAKHGFVVSGLFITSGVSVLRSGFRMLGPSSDETSCVRRTQVWTRPRTGRPCLEERHPDRPRRFPTPPWAPPALPRPSQTWPTPQCPPSPPYWPPSRAAWTFTNAGVHRRAP